MNTRFATLFALLCAVVALASAHVDHEVAKQLQELREQNELMRAELAKYRKAIESAVEKELLNQKSLWKLLKKVKIRPFSAKLFVNL